MHKVCGQRIPCAKKALAEPLDLDLRFSLVQDSADGSHGTLTLHNTGHPALDGRPLAATIERRRVHVMEHADNLPATCTEQHDLEIVLDFDGYANSFLHFDEVRTPDCAAAPDDYCKGELHLEFGNLGTVCIATKDLQAVIDRERTSRAHCQEDRDCVAVFLEAACLSECPVAVRKEEVAAFTKAISAAGDAYCAERASCGRDDDCPGAVGAECRDGLCEALFSMTR